MINQVERQDILTEFFKLANGDGALVEAVYTFVHEAEQVGGELAIACGDLEGPALVERWDTLQEGLEV